MIATEGNITVVDHRVWDLSLDQACDHIMSGGNLEVKPFPSFDGDISEEYPESEHLTADDFKGNTRDQVIEYLRMYSDFAKR